MSWQLRDQRVADHGEDRPEVSWPANIGFLVPIKQNRLIRYIDPPATASGSVIMNSHGDVMRPVAGEGAGTMATSHTYKNEGSPR